jgi:hypothetical protein
MRRMSAYYAPSNPGSSSISRSSTTSDMAPTPTLSASVAASASAAASAIGGLLMSAFSGASSQQTSQPKKKESPLTLKVTYIHQTLLRSIDPVLHAHLEKTEVIPQLYLLRWLRLLLCREFTRDQVML